MKVVLGLGFACTLIGGMLLAHGIARLRGPERGPEGVAPPRLVTAGGVLLAFGVVLLFLAR